MFTLVWIAWTNGTLHHELNGHEDARARHTFLLQILVLVALGAFIPEAGGARGAAFAVAAGVLFAVLAVPWRLAARGDRPHTAARAVCSSLGRLPAQFCWPQPALIPAIARTSAWGLIDTAYLAGFAALIAVVIGFGARWTYFDFAGHRHLEAKPTASLQGRWCPATS